VSIVIRKTITPSRVPRIALEVHRRAGLVLDLYLDTRRLGEVKEGLRGPALGKLGAVEAAE
jgi:hypothetical protein